MAKFRDIARTIAPARVRALVREAKAAFAGPGIEEVVLGPYRLDPEETDRRRLTLLIPSIEAREAFGGVNTGIEFLIRLVQRLEAIGGPIDVRVLAEDGAPAERTILPAMAARLGFDAARVALGRLPPGGAVPTRATDLFIAYNWWVGLNLHDLLRAQHARWGGPRRPRYQLVQDYEPAFYPFSSAHLLALQSFNMDWPLHCVFNSGELMAFYTAQGNRLDRGHVFEPRLSPMLRPLRDGVDVAEKERLILVYGRPQVPRNCFSILRRGLELWSRSGRAVEGWRIVSAGAPHPPIDLGGGRRIDSLGKLSLADYAALLRRAGVGVSLMASPHPSYPPLEMAHFGVRVVTNAYPGKDLSRRHDNIRSLQDARPEALAAAIDETCAAFEADPGLGLRGVSRMPDYLSDAPFDCLDALADDMLSAWSAAAPTAAA
jgi:glycosyltransferase involved in cell wall biosynthesis